MTTLADGIEALRLQMRAATEEEARLVEALGHRLWEDDIKIQRALEAIVADHADRRHAIANVLAVLAARIGHLPRVGPPPLPAAAVDAQHDGFNVAINVDVGDEYHPDRLMAAADEIAQALSARAAE